MRVEIKKVVTEYHVVMNEDEMRALNAMSGRVIGSGPVRETTDGMYHVSDNALRNSDVRDGLGVFESPGSTLRIAK